MTQQEIDALLSGAADAEYLAFNAKIVRSQLPMLGVRAPFIKNLAKQIARDPDDFFDTYKAENYEQILLYGLALAAGKMPLDRAFDYFDSLLPKFDNWAHVDMITGAFKRAGKDPDAFLRRYARLAAAPTFERRVLVVYLMNYCLTEDRLPEVFALYEKMQCDEYYVNMGIAWGLSVALVKFYEQTVSFLQKNTFNDFIVNKTVQKARESYRIPPARKQELLALKRK